MAYSPDLSRRLESTDKHKLPGFISKTPLNISHRQALAGVGAVNLDM